MRLELKLMSRPPELHGPERELTALLTSVESRLRIVAVLRALVVASTIAAAGLLALRLTGAGRGAFLLLGAACLAAAALALLAQLQRVSAGSAAARLEAAHGGMHNLLVTAQQLLATPERTRPYMRHRVVSEAVRRASGVTPRKAVSLSPALAAAAVAGILIVLASRAPVTAKAPSTAVASPMGPGAQPTAATPGSLRVEITPPQYTGLASKTLTNPDTIEALEGSRLRLFVAGAVVPRLRVNGAELKSQAGAGGYSAHAVPASSGYIAVESSALRRVIPLTIVPDRVPDVRITAPAKDLRVPDAARKIAIEAAARDDLALQRLEVRYTKISGKGEQFEFTEGALDTRLSQRSPAEWQGSAELDLRALQLEPGDALVYRAVAADRRPGPAGQGTSETFFVEVAGPGEIALPGFDMPPERERYALSQQMIVLKIERLRARERTLSSDELVDAAGGIAAEQRAVRANFIFLLGGTVEDEEEEAHGESEIAEGRFENDARREVLSATRLMQQVEQALALPSTGQALPPARAAAQALQRAFGHNRYLLRALAERSRVDPSRRLSGDLASASDWKRALADSGADAKAAAARLAFGDLLVIAERFGTAPPSSSADALTTLSEHVLDIEPGAADLIAAATAIQSSRDAAAAGRVDDARAALDRAAAPLAARSQHGGTATITHSPDLTRLAGAVGGGGR